MKENKPIALFITDTHLHDDNSDLVFDIFKQASNICLKYKLKYILHGGDLFTNRKSQTLKTLLVFMKILKLLNKNGIEFLAIPGNHDKTDQDSEKSYLDIFDNRFGFKVFSKQEIIDFQGINLGFLPFFSFSYEERLAELNKVLKTKRNNGKFNLLITHFGFNGAVNNDGTIVDDSISEKSVKVWDKLLVGHYHDSNDLGIIKYTGSAYQANYGERNDDKGFHILFDNGDTEFIESDYKKYFKVKLSMDDNIENEIELYSEKDANIRFIFSGKREDLHKVNRSELDKLGIDVKFEFDEVNQEILNAESGDIVKISKSNIIKYFKEYAKIQDFGKDKISKGLKILIK